MRNKMKRVLCALLAIALCPIAAIPQNDFLCITVCAETEDIHSEALEWRFDEQTGTLIVTGAGEMQDYKALLDIPWYSYRDEIIRVQISNGITCIGMNAFRDCVNLKEVMLPDGMLEINAGAFNRCLNLKVLHIPDTVTSIGDYAFYQCAFEEITLPSSLNNLSPSAFECCKSLSAFYITENHPLYSVKDGILMNADGSVLLSYPIAKCSDMIQIPDTVTEIGAYAFNNCSDLQTITIPDSVTVIGEKAFLNCGKLKSVTFPEHEIRIGQNAFQNTAYPDSIRDDSGFSVTPSGILIETAELTGDIILPENVRYIGGTALSALQCSSLTIPAGCKVDASACSSCETLTELRIGENCTIGEKAFENCTALQKAVIGKGTEFADNIFYGCTQLNDLQYDRMVLGTKYTDLPEDCVQIAEMRLLPQETGAIVAGTLSRTHGLLCDENKAVAMDYSLYNNGFDNRLKDGTRYPDTVQEMTDADGNIYAAVGFQDSLRLIPYQEDQTEIHVSYPGFQFGAAAISEKNELFVYWSFRIPKHNDDKTNNTEELEALANHTENNVIAKYSMTGELLGVCGFDINETHSLTPLDRFNANLVVKDGVAACLFSTGRTRTQSPDRVYHQSCCFIAADADSMEPVFVNHLPIGGHTFGVRLIPTEYGIAAVGMNDMYRGMTLCTWKTENKALTRHYLAYDSTYQMFHCNGDADEAAGDANDMYIHIGGFAKSGSTYAVAGRSQRYLSSAYYANQPQRSSEYYDVFIALSDKTLHGDGSAIAGEPRIDAKTGQLADQNVIWLTEGDQHISFGEVKLFTLDDGSYCVMWERYEDKQFDSIRYVILDTDGNILRHETEIRGARLSCTSIPPIVKDGKLIWAVTDEDADSFTWFTVDLQKSANRNAQELPDSLTRLAQTYHLELSAENYVYGLCGINIEWAYFKQEKTLLLYGTGGISYRSASPWAEYAEEIESLCFGSGITDIGSRSFEKMTALKSAMLPANLKSLGDYAFNECDNLTEIRLPDKLETIGANAFRGCNITFAIIPESVKIIGDYAFLNENDLPADFFVLNPEAEIGSNAFAYFGLTSLYQNHNTRLYGKEGSTIQKYREPLWSEISFIPISGQCGATAFWDYDVTKKELRIYGTGSIYPYASGAEPWSRLEIDHIVPENGFPRPEKGMYGDSNCDGKLSIADAVLLARIIAEDNAVSVTEDGKLNADMNSNRLLNEEDLMDLLHMIMQMQSTKQQ